MRGDGALVHFKRVRDFLRQDVEEQRLRTLLEEVSLRNEIVEQREDDRDHAAEVQDEEPGDERLRQRGWLERGLENRAHDQEQDEAHDPQQSLAQILDQKRDDRTERRPDDHRARIPEAAKAHRDKPGQHKGHEKLDEAVEAEVAGPRKQRRIDRRGDRIDRRRGGGERSAGGEINHRPQDRQRQGADGQEDHHQPLQRRVAAFARIGADACGERDQLRGCGARPAEPADVRRLVSPHGFPSGDRNLRAASTPCIRHSTKDAERRLALRFGGLLPARVSRRDEGERDHEQREARRRPLPQAAVGPLEHGPERERGAERGLLGDDDVAGGNARKPIARTAHRPAASAAPTSIGQIASQSFAGSSASADVADRRGT